MKRLAAVLLSLAVFGAVIAFQPPRRPPPFRKRPFGRPAEKADPKVNIQARGGYRYITSNGIPSHKTGQFPNRNNPNAVSAQRYTFRVPLQPEAADRPTPTGRTLFGVALNGVPFDPGTAEFWRGDRRWNYEAVGGRINLGLDESNAHVQPTGAYHYHGTPVGFIQKLNGAKKMTLIGYAADGFPVYNQYGFSEAKDSESGVRKMKSGYVLKPGARPGGPGGRHDGTFTLDYEFKAGVGDLDEYNGRFGVTPENANGVYHYHITDTFPYVPRLLKGTPDASFRKGPPPFRRKR